MKSDLRNSIVLSTNSHYHDQTFINQVKAIKPLPRTKQKPMLADFLERMYGNPQVYDSTEAALANRRSAHE